MSKLHNPEMEDRIRTHDDEKKRVVDLYSMKLVPPATGIFDDPVRCYRANKEWAKIISGMVMQLTTVAAWRDAGEENYIGITEIQKFLVGSECDDMPFLLRQKPEDFCILEQSTDGGETWTEAFNFADCVTIQDKSYQVQIQNSTTYVQQTFQEIYNNFTTNYAGNPESVYPNLADPVGDDSALRAAYCNAIWELVRTACNTAVSYYTETINQQQSEINVALGVTAFLLAAISLAFAIPTGGASLTGLAPAAALWAAGISLGAVFGNALVDFWQQHTIDQFQDTEAMEAVTCYIFEDVAAADNSWEAMKTSVAGVLTGDPNGQAILDFLQILLSHDSTYAAFLEKWDNNKQFADAGIDLYCPCVASVRRVWVWDFSNGLGEFTLVKGVQEAGRIRGVDTGTNYEIELTIPWTPGWRAAGAMLSHERVNSLEHGTGDAATIHWRLTPGTDVGNIASIPNGGFLPSGELEFCQNFPIAPFYIEGANQLWVHLFASDIAGAELYLDKITVGFIEGFHKGGYKTDDTNICA